MLPRVVLVFLLVGVTLSADRTRVENSSGPEVVEAVVNIIRESCLFADDKRFLRRLAYVESEDGKAPKTYRPGYNGGIWQVSWPTYHLSLISIISTFYLHNCSG